MDKIFTYEEHKLYKKYFENISTLEELENKFKDVQGDKTLDEGKMQMIGYIFKKLQDAFTNIKNKRHKKKK